MNNIQHYTKAIVAFIGLVIAVAQANGFEIPAETQDQISSAVTVLFGTLAVWFFENKPKKEINK